MRALSPLGPAQRLRTRFFVTYAAAAAAVAAAVSGVTSLAYLTDEARVAGAPRLVESLLRSVAPMASGSALLLALVWWAHSLPASRLQAELEGGLKWALLAVLPGYLLASLIGFLVCLAMALGLVEHGSSSFWGWLSQLGPRDVAIGASSTLLDTALIWLLARRYGLRLQGAGTLPSKLVVVLTVTVPLRATLALVFASVVPG